MKLFKAWSPQGPSRVLRGGRRPAVSPPPRWGHNAVGALDDQVSCNFARNGVWSQSPSSSSQKAYSQRQSP